MWSKFPNAHLPLHGEEVSSRERQANSHRHRFSPFGEVGGQLAGPRLRTREVSLAFGSAFVFEWVRKKAGRNVEGGVE